MKPSLKKSSSARGQGCPAVLHIAWKNREIAGSQGHGFEVLIEEQQLAAARFLRAQGEKGDELATTFRAGPEAPAPLGSDLGRFEQSPFDIVGEFDAEKAKVGVMNGGAEPAFEFARRSRHVARARGEEGVFGSQKTRMHDERKLALNLKHRR